MNIESRMELFKCELDLIFDTRIKEFTKLCLAIAPNYIFTDCPSSSTGKYHPLNEMSWDGVILHTKKVFHVCYAMTKGLDIEDKRDVVLASAIIHDLAKRGYGESESKWTKKEHPQLAAELVDKVQRETKLLTDYEYETIRSCVFYHYGPWTTKESAKPMEDYSLEELCVYLSDYVATKEFLDVRYKDVIHE